MLKNKKISRAISLLTSIIIVLGCFGSISVYAAGANQIRNGERAELTNIFRDQYFEKKFKEMIQSAEIKIYDSARVLLLNQLNR